MAHANFEEQDYLGRDVYECEPIQNIKCVVDRHYVVNSLIGQGTYSLVCGGIDKRNGQKLAIKKIKKSIFRDAINSKRILREINILSQVKHEAVIEMLDLIPPKSKDNFDECYIVFKRMKTDLRHLIHSQTQLFSSHITYIGYQMFRALLYLHSVGVVHRDLTPANILIAETGCEIQICDFGLSRKMLNEQESGSMTRHVVTRWYRAPEIMCWDEYHEPVDIWAAACILTELFTRQPLFPGEHFIHQLTLIFEKLGSPCDEDCSKATDATIKSFLSRLKPSQTCDWAQFLEGTVAAPEAIDLISRILIFNPDQRMTCTDILAHPFFEEWHDPTDEPVGEKLITDAFEDTEDIEEIKEYLWQYIVDITRKNFESETDE